MKNKVLVVSFQSLTREYAGGVGRIGYYLSEELSKKDMLKKFVVSSKGKYSTPFPSESVSFFTAFYIRLLGVVSRFLGYKKRIIEEWLFDFFLCRHLSKDLSMLISTNPQIPKTLKRAKKYKIVTVYIPGTPELNAIYSVVHKEQIKWGVSFKDIYTSKFRLKTYNKAMGRYHYIVTYSSVMYESFVSRSYKNVALEKGCLAPLYLLSGAEEYGNEKTTDINKIRVGYLAYSQLLKGLHYILQAWKDEGLYQVAELYIGGTISESVRDIIKQYFNDLPNVFYTGFVSDKASFFSNVDLFLAPSLIDGAPVNVLEAMSYGVAPVVTQGSGSKDMIENHKNGFVIEDFYEIKDIIYKSYADPYKVRDMGKHARNTIRSFDLKGFKQRLTNRVLEVTGFQI